MFTNVRLPDSEKMKFLTAIDRQLELEGSTLSQAISMRQLYFRVSLVGACNLNCPFCHNEGGPKKGRLDLDFGIKAMIEAQKIGYQRVQFTGGEPLLHPQLIAFVREGKQIFREVGITTNGTYLDKHLASLVDAGIDRIHISLQTESLEPEEPNGPWKIPWWLSPVLDAANENKFKLRLNLPVPADKLNFAELFLRKLSVFDCDLKVFSILPEKEMSCAQNPVGALAAMVGRENERRRKEKTSGEIILRGYREPAGIRCKSCKDFHRCKEQSHSLRLGVNNVLRPCLASRDWDIKLQQGEMSKQLEMASLLALDYVW